MSRPFASRALLALFSVAIGVTLVEVGTRIWLNRFADDDAFLRYAALGDLDETRLASLRVGSERRYTPHRYLGYVPTPNYRSGKNRHNALGFRGEEIPLPKPQGEFRIACIGGSTTYTFGVEDYQLSYPAQLERELKRRGHSSVRVINAGAESYSSWESLINLQFRVLDLEPDLVVVYHAVNDAHSRFVSPHEAYRGDNSGRRSPNAESMVMPSLLEHSAFLRFLLVRSGRVAPHADFARTIDRSPVTFLGDDFWRQWKQKTYPSGIFAQTSAETMLDRNPPIFFERNLRSMVAVAQSQGIAVVIATFATTSTYGDAAGSSPPYLRALAENNEVNRKVAQATSAHLFDFAAVFPPTRKYWVDGEHVNFQGARLKARFFADYLIAEGLLPGAQHSSATTTAVH